MWAAASAVVSMFAIAACGGDGRELMIDQYDEVALPGVADTTVYLGDVSIGRSAPITIRRAGVVVAQGTLRPGDELPFVLADGAHVVKVVKYEDHLVVDRAKLAVADRRPSSKSVLRAVQGTQTALPSAPDIQITVDKLEPPIAELTVVTPTSRAHERLDLGRPMTFELRGTPYFVEPLSFDDTAIYVRVAPVRR